MYTLFAFLASCIGALICWLVCLAALHFWHQKKKHLPPALFYSDITPLLGPSPYGRARWVSLPYLLLLTALGALLLAWWNPPLPLSHPAPIAWKQSLPPLPSEGIAYYLLVDRSGSMSQMSPFAAKPMRKIDLLKESTLELIGAPEGDNLSQLDTSRGSTDLVGIIGFARSAQVLSPLTLDRTRLREIISQLNVVQNPEDEGTGIGYAIFKAVQLISATKELSRQETQSHKQRYDIQNAFLIVLTDGFQEPSPLDQGKWLRTMGLEEAAAYAKKEGVKLYIINMEPSLEKEQFAPHRRLLESVTQLTGGRFFLLSQNQDLNSIYTTIRNQEQTLLPLGLVSQDQPSSSSLFEKSLLVPYLLILALCCLAAALIALSTSHRMVP